MSDDRKKPLWPWIVAVLVGLPILYVLSLGPWVWFSTHKVLPGSVEEWRIRMTATYAAPFNFVYDRAPDPVPRLMNGYIRMWMGER